MEWGYRLTWRHCGLGINVVYEPYYRGAWITLGPLCVWFELG